MKPEDIANHRFVLISSRLQDLRSKLQQDPQGGIKAAAKQFEGMFVQMVMKSMRDATPSDGVFNSDATRFATGVLDQQMAQQLGGTGQLGFARQIEAQLGRMMAQSSGTATFLSRPRLPVCAPLVVSPCCRPARSRERKGLPAALPEPRQGRRQQQVIRQVLLRRGPGFRQPCLAACRRGEPDNRCACAFPRCPRGTRKPGGARAKRGRTVLPATTCSASRPGAVGGGNGRGGDNRILDGVPQQTREKFPRLRFLCRGLPRLCVADGQQSTVFRRPRSAGWHGLCSFLATGRLCDRPDVRRQAVANHLRHHAPPGAERLTDLAGAA